MSQKGLPVRQAGLAPILIVVLLAIALVGGYFIYQKNSSVQHTQTKSDFPFPTKQVFTNDAEFTELKEEEVHLNFGSLGQEYFRSEQHQGITGGFYPSIPFGASLYLCYAAPHGLSDLVDPLDKKLQNNSWRRKEVPGYTIETVKDLLRKNMDLTGYSLGYSKDTSSGTVYASIQFYRDQATSCSSKDATPMPKYNEPTFAVTLHYLE